jgi:lipopolysaccharide exporter
MSTFKDLFSGIKWSFISQFGRQILQFIKTIILVKLLSPEDFGLMSIALIMTGFLNIIQNSGISASAIQKLSPTSHFLSSIFWFNILVSFLIFFLIFFTAESVALFFEQPEVENILKLMSVTFIISGLGNIQRALLQKENKFNLLAKFEFLSFTVSSISAVLLAYYGYGFYSLVFQSIISSSIGAVLLFFSGIWYPKFYCKIEEIHSVLSYSINLIGANVLGFFMRHVDNFIIGKYLGAESLGYYNIAYRIMLIPLENIVDAVKRVLFPILSKLQNNVSESKRIYVVVTYVIFLIICPLMLGIWAINEYFVMYFWGEKWKTLVDLIFLLAPIGILQSFVRLSGSIMAAKGKANLLLYINLFSSLFIIPAFIIGLKWGLIGIATSYLIANLIVFYPSLYIPYKLIELKFKEIINEISIVFYPSIIMVITIFILKLFFTHISLLSLLILILGGILVFTTIAWKLNFEKIKTIYGTIKIGN